MPVFLIAVLIWISVHVCDAQTRLGVGATTGVISTGTNFSAGLNQFSLDFRGVSTGLFFESMSNRYVGLRWEFLFSHKGFGMQDSLYFYRRHIYYLETPMMTHVELGKNNWRIILQGGPQLGTPIHSWERVDSDSRRAMERFDTLYTLTERTNKLERFQFGLVAAIGGNYKISSFLLQAEVRYYQGFSNVLAPRKFTFFQQQTFGFYVSLQYILPQKSKPIVKEE